MSAAAIRLARLVNTDPARARLEAARLLSADKARKGRVRVKAGERKREDEKDRAVQAKYRGLIRARAMTRDGARCVVCGYMDNDLWPLHMHHIIGRHDERLETVAMLCDVHHEKGKQSMHAGCLETMSALAAYCVQHGMTDAARHLARRIAKAEDCRAQSYPKGRDPR